MFGSFLERTLSISHSLLIILAWIPGIFLSIFWIFFSTFCIFLSIFQSLLNILAWIGLFTNSNTSTESKSYSLISIDFVGVSVVGVEDFVVVVVIFMVVVGSTAGVQ